MKSIGKAGELYHYTECGLDFVYLANGFRFIDSPRGQQVVIADIDGLHEFIGRVLVTEKKDLSGRDVRFLRHEMGLSQASLAKLLSVSEQAVRRWESGKTDQIAKPAESIIRLLYREYTKKDTEANSESLRSTLKRIAALEDQMDRLTLEPVKCDGHTEWARQGLRQAA